MANYCESTDITARIPGGVQLQGLDDDADGVADTGLLDSILAAASRWVDGQLRRTEELSSPYAELAQQAAIARACWQVYERAGSNGKDNPMLDEMLAYQRLLVDIAAGKGSLDAAGGVPSSLITDPELDDDDPSLFVDPTGL